MIRFFFCGTRSGYRIQVDPDGNATRAIYYMERELANLDPTRPGNYNRMDTMSEVSSLHDRGRAPAQYDQDEAMSTISSVSQHVHRRPDDRRPDDRRPDDRRPDDRRLDDRRPDDRRPDDRRGADSCGRARSMDNLDDIGRRYDRDDRGEYRRRPEEPRGRRGSDDGWSSSARSGNDRGYDRVYDDRRRRDYSPDDRHSDANSGLAGRRSRSRDDLMDLERERRYGDGGRGGLDYDDGLLREAMERKKMSEQQRTHSRDRLDTERPPPLPSNPPSGYPGRHDDYPPPLPPPYSDNESMSSAKKSNLRKNGAVSRESLVV
uniref:Uncharacterized protein n=2 Tax=Knipowitschia caucasica TaxID=637954 RepID=A0AAV2M9G3_KNICA